MRQSMEIGRLLELGIGMQARCQGCRQVREIDLAKLIELKGANYSLFDRCTTCRLTRDCKGRVVFFRMSPFCQHYSERREYYWSELDWLERMYGTRDLREAAAMRAVDQMFTKLYEAKRGRGRR